ncbi:MAG: hypothetical protein KJ077_10935 [Anaerolineae bacterium]|nr:hypothetical protein [Anaerolineae bacterium]
MPKKKPDEQIVELPLNECLPDPLGNDRKLFSLDGLTRLAWSVHETGLAQPITVRLAPEPAVPVMRDDLGIPAVEIRPKYHIIAGERRWRSHWILTDRVWAGEWPETDKVRPGFIKAIIRTLNDEEALDVMFTENIHREDLDPMSEAEAYEKRMRVNGWTIAIVAKKAKVSVDRVKQALKLGRLAPEIKELVRSGQLKPNIARELADLDFDGQRAVMAWVARQKFTPSADQISGHVTRLLEEKLQGTMFGDDALGGVYAPVVRKAAQEGKFLDFLPTLDYLPDLPITGAKIGVIIDAYIAQLIEEGHDMPARVMADFWRKLLRRNQATMNVFDSKTLPMLEKIGTDTASRKRPNKDLKVGQLVWAIITSDRIPTQGMVLQITPTQAHIRSTRTKKAYPVAIEDVMVRPPVGIGRILFTVVDEEVERGTVEEITETGVKLRLLKNGRVIDVPDALIHYTGTNARETILQRTED